MAKKKHTGNEHDDFILKPDLSITFKGKSSLKRSEETGIPLEDELLIAVLEGDAKNKDIDAEQATIYAQTKLHPDRDIVYPDHASLKKRPAIIPVYASYAAAALILLLISIGSWFIFNPETVPVTHQYDLASIERISASPLVQETRMITLSGRVTEGMRISSPARVSFELHEMEAIPPTDIELPVSLLAYEAVFTLRPLNTTHSAINTASYAYEEPKKKGLLGKIFSGLFNKVSVPLEQANQPNEGSSNDGFLWNVAQLGVKSVNLLGDHDYTLLKDVNQKGNVKGVIVLEE